MLPDFVRIKARRRARFLKILTREQRKHTPILRQIRTHQQHEGSRIDYTTVDGETDQITYDTAISTTGQFCHDDLPNMDDAWLRAKAIEMSEELGAQSMKMFLSKIDEVTDKAGQVSHAGGKPFSPNMLIESLRKLRIDFDEKRRPTSISFLTHPAMADTLKGALRDAEQSPEFQAKWNELMQLKWIEYRDREADRKLVD